MSDGRGRHTTVTRELIQMAGGGVLIDTPGLRALALTGSEAGIASAFPDIDQVSQAAVSRDCTHRPSRDARSWPRWSRGRCALERLASYQKLLREAQVAAMKTDARLRAEEERKWKIIRKAAKEYNKRTGRT